MACSNVAAVWPNFAKMAFSSNESREATDVFALAMQPAGNRVNLRTGKLRTTHLVKMLQQPTS
jgi:hypothetical protein